MFSLFKVANSKDAVKLANESQYGLAGCVISKDIKKAEEICEELECGSTFVNDFAKSDSRLPMGGIKNSGYGRECGKMGALEFTNIKTLSIS